MFWIVPPVQLALQVPPLPVTMRLPEEPVVFSTMPFAPPLAEMLRNSSPLAPIVVLATLSAVPVVVASVLTSAPVTVGLHGFSSHTCTVPPPVAVNAALAPAFSVNPPLKLTWRQCCSSAKSRCPGWR